MNLQPVSEPKGLTYPCIRCGKRQRDTESNPVHADLDGIPFRAYYCTPCAQERRVEREASGVFLGPIVEVRS